MKRDLAIRALDMAVALRKPPKDCIHHTDRGSQYCSNEYQRRLKKHGFKVSMSGKGNCYDNSMVVRIAQFGHPHTFAQATKLLPHSLLTIPL
jgi:transposase InsO family protein